MSRAIDNPWSARAPVIFGLFGLLVLFGGFAVWATQANIAGAIIASGRIEVDRNRQIVQHPTGGVVAEIAVQEGDTVMAGDLLLSLDDRQAQSQLAIIEGQLYELMARRGRLEVERDQTDDVVFEDELLQAGARNPDLEELISGQRNLFLARRDSVAGETEQLQKRQSQIQNQIDGIEAQELALALQLGLIKEELTSQQALLDKGLAQATRVLALQRQQASLEGQLGELAANKAQAEGRITEIDLEILKLSVGRREEAITQLRDLRYRELELVEQRASLMEDIESLQLRAPVSGIVYGMRVQTPRSVIRGADPILYLIPQDRPLVIVAQVDTIHIDQVHVGQQVNLRLSALDQRSTPELVGQVALISADAFEDEARGQTYYRAEITLNPGELEKLNEGDVLIPGMPVEAFIRTADRTPMAYLIKPFADYFTRAFRET
ncbi:HlyD family type I secretion periplasmic adaptor subunit [Pseudosulfitobacter koreensis]|uniref:Membrane fusion protein (MFP) family protein n=1 Tax=Pseudosulfitobacter koreensis TaxID=2968472 RepID=A0ABT1YW57_9RHOB|nr:HlyD family type I secretion periplasmic adaptor subunit [Pseudosulfitobacter koreense]MCR8825130.1 HlyD family type I secretion periplasmic adaptor subunit [Pseudosulfitobacter koreense]